MQVRAITQQNEWQEFIEAVRPSSFLHSWQWGEFEAALGHPVFRYGVYDKSELVAVALFSKIKARRGTFLLCPHGPIVMPEYLGTLSDILRALRDHVIPIGKEEKCDVIRISTLIIDKPEHRAAFKELGFRDAPIHMYSELAWILDVTPSEEDLLKGMKKNTRYSIRKAEKDGVAVRKSESLDDFETFWKIYMATVTRQKFTPYSYDFLRKEFELFFTTGQAALFFGEYKGEPISTAFVVYANGSGFYHHGASDQKFPGITPSELVQWEAIKEARRLGMQKYNFWGIVPESTVDHPWQGLSKFKRSFGGYAEAYVHAQDYILTPMYWINYAVERIRKIKRRL